MYRGKGVDSLSILYILFIADLSDYVVDTAWSVKVVSLYEICQGMLNGRCFPRDYFLALTTSISRVGSTELPKNPSQPLPAGLVTTASLLPPQGRRSPRFLRRA